MALSPVVSDDERRRAIVVSASMGADHDSAAHEMRRRLEAQGYDVQVPNHLSAVRPWGCIVRASCGATAKGLSGGTDLRLRWLHDDTLLAPAIVMRGPRETSRAADSSIGLVHARLQGDAPMTAALDRAATANGPTNGPVPELVDERR